MFPPIVPVAISPRSPRRPATVCLTLAQATASPSQSVELSYFASSQSFKQFSGSTSAPIANCCLHWLVLWVRAKPETVEGCWGISHLIERRAEGAAVQPAPELLALVRGLPRTGNFCTALPWLVPSDQ